jgi:hypothetical protein
MYIFMNCPLLTGPQIGCHPTATAKTTIFLF